MLNLHSAYQVTKRLQLFASVLNAADARYYTYGTFSPTRQILLSQAPNATNPRSCSPAAPVGAFGGARVIFSV